MTTKRSHSFFLIDGSPLTAEEFVAFTVSDGNRLALEVGDTHNVIFDLADATFVGIHVDCINGTRPAYTGLDSHFGGVCLQALEVAPKSYP